MIRKYYCIVVLIVISLISCQERKVDLVDILGKKIDVIHKNYEYGDYLRLTGEGYVGLDYSISKIEMDSVISIINDQKLPLEKESFSTEHWQKTPMNKQNIIDLVSTYYSTDKKILEFQKRINKKLTGEGNYFSYYYKETEGNIYEIELYILDRKNNKIYIVKHSI